jgi:hypothetical protein
VKESTACFGLYRKAIIRLYIIVDLTAVGGGGEISPYKPCVGFRSLSSSTVRLFFMTSITVGSRVLVVPGVRCGWVASVACFSPALGMDVSPVDVCIEGEVMVLFKCVGGWFELIAYLLVN